ncbi:putative GPI-anchored protein [Rosa sericea]
MACLIKLCFFFVVIIQASLLLSPLVHSDDEADEDDILQGINSYRRSLSLPNLIKHDKADCLAEEIADDIQDQPCSSRTNGANISPTSVTELPSLPSNLIKCKIDVNSTVDGVIMPVCVPKAVSTLVLTNYTSSPRYAKFLNDSRFTGVGVGTKDDWTVVVLATSTRTGSFANAAGSLVSTVGAVHYLVSFMLGLWLSLVS